MLIQTTVSGHTALFLENERMRVGVLPEKGADIFEFTHKSADRSQDIQFLMQTPWGLKPPADHPALDFLENYEGGWQELFPNANDGCKYRGQDIPFHGEVALLPWQFEVLQDDPAETVLHLSVTCKKTPFRLERSMRLRRAQSRLRVQEKVTNIGDEACEFVWGHHIVLGGNFLEGGCLLDIPAQKIFTPDVLFEPLTARLKEGQTADWPLGCGRKGEFVDLRVIPGPQIHSHDDVILGGLTQGVFCLTNPRLKMKFSLVWDADVFPWVMYWQPYGGADLAPLSGIYGVGLEPWVSRYPLADAVKANQAKILQGGQSLETEMVVEILQT
jgi:galactose mutarotase-like enzyme